MGSRFYSVIVTQKGAIPHPHPIAFLTNAQLRRPLLNVEVSLAKLTEQSNYLDKEARPGCRLDNFSDHGVFHPCNASSIGKRNQYLANLDRMCQEALNIMDASLIPDRNLQTVFSAYSWRSGQQVSSSRAPAGKATRCGALHEKTGITKATNLSIPITDSLASARRSVRLSIRSGQVHSVAVVKNFRAF